MSYARLTLQDPNALKRLLQRRRLRDALRALADVGADFDGQILDIGGGDGCFSRLLAERFPRARIVCYEPTPKLRSEAAENLKGTRNIELVGDLLAVSGTQFDAMYCLEVFEHLARRDLRRLLAQIADLLASSASFVVGVPNELHAMAAAKGMFRMFRRYGDFDARVAAVTRAALGIPHRRRLRTTIGPALPYYPHHLGFDHRMLARLLAEQFDVVRTFGSPLAALPLACNAELYFVCRKRSEDVHGDTPRTRRCA